MYVHPQKLKLDYLLYRCDQGHEFDSVPTVKMAKHFESGSIVDIEQKCPIWVEGYARCNNPARPVSQEDLESWSKRALARYNRQGV